MLGVDVMDLSDEHGYVKKVGWRIIRGIRCLTTAKADIFEGYYLRRPKYLFEDGLQKVPVRNILGKRLDHRWEVIDSESSIQDQERLKTP